jgi:hypothetical protein
MGTGSNGLKLYSYFDQVDYEPRWAILDNNGNCIYHWKDREHGNNYNFFNAIVEIQSNIKLLGGLV